MQVFVDFVKRDVLTLVSEIRGYTIDYVVVVIVNIIVIVLLLLIVVVMRRLTAL